MFQPSKARRAAAIGALKLHDPSTDAEQIVHRLDDGLSLLVDRFYERIHLDVEQQVGRDSLFEPLSEEITGEKTEREIEIYQVVESAWAAREFGYAAAQGDWYLAWLTELRLGEHREAQESVGRLAGIRSSEARRKAFMNDLMKVMPESSKSPLVLFLLFPVTIHLATALAFGDRARADSLRAQQITWLPAIDGCSRCRGKVLENGRSCDACGNPLWTYRWLTSTD